MAQMDKSLCADKLAYSGGQVCKIALGIAGNMDTLSVFEDIPPVSQL